MNKKTSFELQMENTNAFSTYTFFIPLASICDINLFAIFYGKLLKKAKRFSLKKNKNNNKKANKHINLIFILYQPQQQNKSDTGCLISFSENL